MYSINPNLNPWDYTTPAISSSENNRLQYLTFTLTRRCNWSCDFCSKGNVNILDFSVPLFHNIINSALTLGLEKIELSGGEALLHPNFWDLVDFAHNKGLSILLSTNGSLINPNIAKKLKEYKIKIAISLYSLNAIYFEKRNHTKGSFQRTLKGIQILEDIGYGKEEDLILALQVLTINSNIFELKQLYDWAKQRNILFIISRAIPNAGLPLNEVPTGEALKDLLEYINNGKKAYLPFSYNIPCNRLKVALHIQTDGTIQPCAGINYTLADLKGNDLISIWQEHNLLKKFRKLPEGLKGNCKDCKENHICYGCRAVAYAVYNDCFAEDPHCHNLIK